MAGARHVEPLEGLERVTAGRPSISPTPTGRPSWSPRPCGRTGGSTCSSTTSAPCTSALDGFLSAHRRRLRGIAADELLRRPARDARRAVPIWRKRGERGDRQRRVRSTPSSSPTAASSTTAQQRPPWSTSPSRSHRSSARTGIRINSVSPGPVETDLWLGDDGVADTVGWRHRRRRRRRPRPDWPGRHRDRQVLDAARGRDARRAARLAAHRKRHRRQLGHRRGLIKTT